MYFFLILFFISLVGIIFMLSKKLMLQNAGDAVLQEEISVEVIDLDKIRHKTLKHTKRYGFILLVITLRLSIKSSYLAREVYKTTKQRIKVFINRISNKNRIGKEREVSNFLKMMSEYKERIKEIKDHIKEEEGIK